MEKTIHSRRYKEFLTLLRKTRVKNGVLQENIATALNITQSAYSKLETGDRRIDIVQLENICSAMNTKLSYFVKQFEKLPNKK